VCGDQQEAGRLPLLVQPRVRLHDLLVHLPRDQRGAHLPLLPRHRPEVRGLEMGIFDHDPAYQRLKALRDSGYRGPVDRDGNPTDEHRDIFDALDRATRRAMERGQK
jgi:hypothetical protein